MATVSDFSEAELWYIYEAITTTSFSGIDQTELFEVFNGTNPQGFAASLFESLSGGDTPLANLFVANRGGGVFWDVALILSNSYDKINSIDTKLTTETTNTGNISTYLSTIRSPHIISTSGSSTISVQIHNCSFYNSGSATGTLTVNGTTVNIPAGVTVNYDAGGNNNRFAANIFSYNATGTTFIISYVQ